MCPEEALVFCRSGIRVAERFVRRIDESEVEWPQSSR